MCERIHWVDSRTDTIDGYNVTMVSYSDGARRVEKMDRIECRRYHEASIRALDAYKRSTRGKVVKFKNT